VNSFVIFADKREMIFNIPKTIAYLSAGTTLEAGSLIMVSPPSN
jgi:2-keto-4-pentenoate hydratase/2-oxohepta-3-ene-1,7-dioic acid hydratase in catechol pathway